MSPATVAAVRVAGKMGQRQTRNRELAVNRRLAAFFIEKSRLQLKLKLSCMSIHPNICLHCGFSLFHTFFYHPNQTLLCLLFPFPFMHIFSYANSIASFLFSLCSTSASYTPLCLDSYLLLFFDSSSSSSSSFFFFSVPFNIFRIRAGLAICSWSVDGKMISFHSLYGHHNLLLTGYPIIYHQSVMFFFSSLIFLF